MNEKSKKLAGERAVDEIESGMKIGLGTGSTVYYSIIKLGELIKSSKISDVMCVPSSKRTEKLANELNIPICTFEDVQEIDLTIDGADEVDKYLNLIKGGGAAHLREKIVVQASKKFIVVVDESKMSDKLGQKWSVPLEVVKFAHPLIAKFVVDLNGEPELRKYESGEPVLTDENNYIIDANFGIIQNPFELADKLENKAGIVEHGLFLRAATKVIVAGENGIRVLER